MASLARSESYVVLPKYHAKELLPIMVDEMAKAQPDALHAETPTLTVTYKASYRKVTKAIVANAVNGIAR